MSATKEFVVCRDRNGPVDPASKRGLVILIEAYGRQLALHEEFPGPTTATLLAATKYELEEGLGAPYNRGKVFSHKGKCVHWDQEKGLVVSEAQSLDGFEEDPIDLIAQYDKIVARWDEYRDSGIPSHVHRLDVALVEVSNKLDKVLDGKTMTYNGKTYTPTGGGVRVWTIIPEEYT